MSQPPQGINAHMRHLLKDNSFHLREITADCLGIARKIRDINLTEDQLKLIGKLVEELQFELKKREFSFAKQRDSRIHSASIRSIGERTSNPENRGELCNGIENDGPTSCTVSGERRNNVFSGKGSCSSIPGQTENSTTTSLP